MKLADIKPMLSGFVLVINSDSIEVFYGVPREIPQDYLDFTVDFIDAAVADKTYLRVWLKD